MRQQLTRSTRDGRQRSSDTARAVALHRDMLWLHDGGRTEDQLI